MNGIYIASGIDTFTVSRDLSWKQKEGILKTIKNLNSFRDESGDYESDYHCFRSDHFASQGIKLIMKKKGKHPWKLYILLHPTLLLGDSDRTSLYCPAKKTYRKMIEEADGIFDKLNVPYCLEGMKLYRADVTINITFSDPEFVEAYLRILKKSLLLPHYSLDWFRTEDHKVKDCKLANRHSYTQRCKSSSFFAYDKTAQLEMIDKFSASLKGKKVLRLEAQLRRNGMRKWAMDDDFDRIYSVLNTLGAKTDKILHWYLSRMKQSDGCYMRYKGAFAAIQQIKGKKTRERMEYLLRKTSDSRDLGSALVKLKNKFDLNNNKVNHVLKQFRKLGISPITLPNSEKAVDKLQPLNAILRRA